jgi:hypothetical protein
MKKGGCYMFTVAVIILPLSLITLAIEFVMDIPNKLEARRQFAMFKRERPVFR